MDSNFQDSRALRTVAALVALAGLQGCFFDVDDSHSHSAAVTPYTGSLVLDWTIERAQDSLDCDDNDASEISIQIDTVFGDPVADVIEDCAAFQAVIDLDPGDYTGTAVLLDPDGLERTTAVDLGDIPIDEGRDTPIEINFPFRSFF